MSLYEDLTAEYIVLAEALNKESYAVDISCRLFEEQFSTPTTQFIFRYICESIGSGDIPTIERMQQLVIENSLDVCAIVDINSFINYEKVREHEQSIVEKHLRRSMREAGTILVENTNTATKNITESAEEAISAITKQYDRISHMTSTTDMANDFVTILKNIRSGKATHGVPCGIASLERELGLLPNGALIVIGARPSQGKTSLALTMAYNLSTQGIPSLFFSLEMDSIRITERLFTMVSKIPSNILQCDLITNKNIQQAIEAQEIIANLNIKFFFGKGKISLQQIVSVSRRMKATHGIRAVFIDQLSGIKIPDGKKNANEASQIGENTKGLCAMAKALNIPVVLLSQLGRMVGDRPSMRDLKNSGCIEEDADIVLLPHDGIIIVDKNRNGAKGDAKIFYDKSKYMFLSSNEYTTQDNHGWNDR